TRDRRVDRDTDAVERATLDDAGQLVPADERAGDLGVADAALGVPVQVRSADPHGGDPHEALSLGRHRHRIVGEAQVVRPVEPCGEVAGRHRRSPVRCVRPAFKCPAPAEGSRVEGYRCLVALWTATTLHPWATARLRRSTSEVDATIRLRYVEFSN